MSNDNNKTPDNGAPVTNLSEVRKQLAAKLGAAGGPQPAGDGPDDGVMDFEAAVVAPDGSLTVLNFKGFIVATGVFVGFANEGGSLVGVIPIDRLVYVNQTNVVDVELEDDEPTDVA